MVGEDPYRPPQSHLAGEAQLEFDSLDVASTGKRFSNLLLDYLGCFVLAFFAGIFLVVFGQEELLSESSELLFGVAVISIYYIPQEAMFGRTFAKLITGTRVVREEGGRPRLLQVVGRTLCRFIPFEAFSFLLGGPRPVGWHDSISKTRVIDLRGMSRRQRDSREI